MKIILSTLNAKYVHHALALRYLSKSVPDARVMAFTINHTVESVCAELYKKITTDTLLGFSVYIWNVEMTLRVLARLKKVAPQLKILLGGPEVSYDPFETLTANTFVDYVIYGEGENTFKALCNANDCVSLHSIEGLAFRQDGQVIVNPPRPLIQDLDTIPSPYTSAELAAFEGKMLYYETSRGCPFTCSYCLSSTTHGVRFFSLDRVLADLRAMLDHRVGQVKFVDRTFNCSNVRTKAIVTFLIQNAAQTNFHFEIAAHLMDDALLALLKSAPTGLFQLEIGVQSTHAKTIQAIHRQTDFEKIATHVKALRQADNMHLHLDVIAGLPYEDYEAFQKTFNDVYALKPHALQLGFLKLLKGAAIRDFEGYTYCDCAPYEVLATPWLTHAQLLALKRMEDMVE
ncbi:MAG: DUF4080 domain-containing protein, partial [Hyphomonadaceae bacterium]|nr:DUF4080 domain-containing protein [Clostridia bacterium]